MTVNGALLTKDYISNKPLQLPLNKELFNEKCVQCIISLVNTTIFVVTLTIF